MSIQEEFHIRQSENETVNSFLSFLDGLKNDINERIQSNQKVEISTMDLSEGIVSSLCIKENFERFIAQIFDLYKYDYVTTGELKNITKRIMIDPRFNTCSFITVLNSKISQASIIDSGLREEIEAVSNNKLKIRGDYTHIFASLPVLTDSNSFYFSQVNCLYNPSQAIYYTAPPCCLFSFHSIIRVLSRSTLSPDEILFQLATWDTFLSALMKQADRLVSKEIVIPAGDSLFLGSIVNDSSYFEVTSMQYTTKNTELYFKQKAAYNEGSTTAEKENANGIILATAIGSNEIKKSHLQIALHKRLKLLACDFGIKPTKDLIDEYIEIHTDYSKRGVIRRI